MGAYMRQHAPWRNVLRYSINASLKDRCFIKYQKVTKLRAMQSRRVFPYYRMTMKSSLMLNSFFVATSAFCNLIMVLEPYEGHNVPACDRRKNSL